MANKFHLLRRLSITSLVAMFITATVLVSLYQRDQIAEHTEIITQGNEKTVVHLMHLLDAQINILATTSDGLDTQDLRAKPSIGLFTIVPEMVREYNILKLKIYNPSGIILYSSVKDEIGGTSTHPDRLAKALRGERTHHVEFRDTFFGATGEMHDIYVALVYVPLTHAGKRIGAIEIYTDATPTLKRIHSNTIRIALIVFCAFAVVYAALFFSAFRADRALAEWQEIIARRDEEISNMAFYDALTQLPNRHLLKDRLVQAMAASKRSGLYGALMFLDLDNFKPLNDMHGHDAGDLLLVEAAHRINSCVREADTVARFGGDEFVVVLNDLDADKAESTTQARIVAEKIHAALAEPYVLKIQRTGGEETTIEYRCTSSIGVVLFVNHEASMGDILRWADMAMYQAKDAGRNLIRFYDLKA